MRPSLSDDQRKDEVLRYFRLELSAEEADSHWQAVVSAHRAARAADGDSLDIRAAALDYFLKRGMLTDPVVVENDSLAAAYELAYQDHLTGLHNYAYFDDESRREVARATRYGHPVALVLVDLDGFKAVNDSAGHQAGNDVLRAVAGVLREGFRSGDVLARFGGDEFALLLHCADTTTGLRVAARVREAVERWFGRPEQDAPGAFVTASLGVAAVPEQAGDPESLVAAADAALYHAKKLGGNRVGFHRNGQLTCLGLFAERHLERRERMAPELTDVDRNPVESGHDPRSVLLRSRNIERRHEAIGGAVLTT